MVGRVPVRNTRDRTGIADGKSIEPCDAELTKGNKFMITKVVDPVPVISQPIDTVNSLVGLLATMFDDDSPSLVGLGNVRF